MLLQLVSSMPYRTTPLINGSFYHIYNRGVAKLPIFEQNHDYKRLLQTLDYYQIKGPKPRFSYLKRRKTFNPDKSKKIVEIIAYCLMPNHFHLLIKQLEEGGITEFVRKFSDSYTKYYNIKYNRVGPLLQGEFKATLIESDEQLVHLIRYIHLNPIVANLTTDLMKYPWSSHQEYLKNSPTICNNHQIASFFKTSEDYSKFLLDQIDYGKQLESLKHQTFE